MTYLNYLKDRFFVLVGMGFHLFHSQQRGLSLSDGNIVSAYIQVCNPAYLSDNSTRNGGIGYIICLVYLWYSFQCYFFCYAVCDFQKLLQAEYLPKKEHAVSCLRQDNHREEYPLTHIPAMPSGLGNLLFNQ